MGFTLRASPRYRLVELQTLPASQQQFLEQLSKDPSVYGLLIPCETNGAGIKVVCQETALLYRKLQTPGSLPETHATDQEAEDGVLKLILDGILEIQHADAFICGPDAFDLLYDDLTPQTSETSALQQLSIAALQYGASLALAEPARLSARLYFYNRMPVSSTMKRRFLDNEAVSDYLGLKQRSIRRLLEPFRSPQDTVRQDGWLFYRSRTAKVPSRKSDGLRFKLYVSPGFEDVPDAFRRTLEACAEYDVPAFKVGQDIYGLLRPDKIVVYLSSRTSLEQVGTHLSRGLKGLSAHGVPFTASLGNDGLLSWGLDPPSDDSRPSWKEKESWRSWITNRLATAMLVANFSEPPRRLPWQFALSRLRLDGVDTDAWCLAEHATPPIRCSAEEDSTS